MAGKGGYKHRKIRLDRKRAQRALKGRQNLRRVRNEFESKGQAWDPTENSSQAAKLDHAARRLVKRSPYDRH
jgi:hypothetical protein